ncbi:hypothetical protein GCM10022381_26570 [Leifsonia kafniensis]|uniref:Uncharacterized protein n=1 Tax=Leifsonia kafniensis TaxID=475957 RepID=A0ABP7KQX1_9MICO
MSRSVMPDLAEFERMKQNLLIRVEVTDKQRKRRHRITAIGVAGALAVAMTAGAIMIAAAPQGQINYLTDCYGAADLNSVHGTSVYLPGDLKETTPTPLAERVRLAEDMCGASWSVGTFADGESVDGVYAVPDLVTCQLPDKRLAVFPSQRPPEELCMSLGLTTPHD